MHQGVAGLLIEAGPRDGALLIVAGGVKRAQEGSEAAVRRVQVQEARRLGAAMGDRVRDPWRHLHPGPRLRAELPVADRDGQLALEHVERLGVAAVDVRRRRRAAGVAARLRDPDLLDVHEQHDALGQQLVAAYDGLCRRAAAVRRRRLLVV